MSSTALIRCEILASRKSVASDLAAIVQVCAQDLGVALRTQKRIGSIRPKNSVLTLHLPVEIAEAQSSIWCLACRLACFCPSTRVSILVRSEDAFGQPAPAQARRKSA